MLRIEFPECEFWDEVNERFVTKNKVVLQLEHSLVSVAKWESKWHKPFLDKKNKTPEETIDYIRCMTITQNVDPSVYSRINNKIVDQVMEYISDPMTATWFSEQKNKSHNREIVTAEIVYYWMISLNIPFECQKWHFNRLLTLIQVCNAKNNPGKKMSRKEILRNNAEINEARRKALHTRG